MLTSGQALTAIGHEVCFLFREQLLSDRWPLRLRRLAVPIALAARVHRLHRERPLDLAEVHEPLAGPYALLASTRWGRRRLPPCVVLSHGLEERCWQAVLQCRASLGTHTSAWSRLSVATTLLSQARLGLRRASHVIVLNRADRDHLVEVLGLPAERVTIAANGVEPELLVVRRRPADCLRVLFLGSWLERKGVGELTKAWPKVHLQHPSARLSLAGVGTSSAADSFPAFCRDSITTMPYVSRAELPGLLADHDALVLPSWFEGMPLAALEAAAAAMAVVATEIPGVVDIFRPPNPELDGAILVGCVRPAELAAAICRLAGDRELLARLQAAARRRASELTWASSASGFASAYTRASSSAAGAPGQPQPRIPAFLRPGPRGRGREGSLPAPGRRPGVRQ